MGGINVSDDLVELNDLWEPVRPYLVMQIEELYGGTGGDILEIGPFSGLVFDLARRDRGKSFLVAAFPSRLLDYYRTLAEEQGVADKVKIVESDPALRDVPDEAFDLAVFRGAIFFPTFFNTDYSAVYGKLKPGGVAFVGGGFGKYTPPEVIDRISERSRDLNLAVGKVRVTEESVREELRSLGLDGKAEIVTEGGLWVVMRKPAERKAHSA
jgi:hypothetical protein